MRFLAFGSADIIDNSVASVDLKNDDVRSVDVRNDTLRGGGLRAPDLATDSVGWREIQPDAVQPSEIASNSVDSDEIANLSLNDQDVGQGTFVNFEANVGVIPSHQCRFAPITGVNALGDHLLLTPSSEDTPNGLIYTAKYKTDETAAWLETCNVTDFSIDDKTSHFSLLVFNAN